MFIYILDESDSPNAATEKSKSKPAEKKPSKKNKENAGARSLGGSRFCNIFHNKSIIIFLIEDKYFISVNITAIQLLFILITA